MKRPRPYIPIPVRLKVALRQLPSDRVGRFVLCHPKMIDGSAADSLRLKMCLWAIFDDVAFHLDHDPPLRARKFNPRTGRYTPDANDPAHLVYRTAEGHRLKTNVRGDGAQFPDRVLIKREKRRERKKAAGCTKTAPRKNKRSWGSRPWPVGRKIPSRPFQRKPHGPENRRPGR